MASNFLTVYNDMQAHLSFKKGKFIYYPLHHIKPLSIFPWHLFFSFSKLFELLTTAHLISLFLLNQSLFGDIKLLAVTTCKPIRSKQHRWRIGPFVDSLWYSVFVSIIEVRTSKQKVKIANLAVATPVLYTGLCSVRRGHSLICVCFWHLIHHWWLQY